MAEISQVKLPNGTTYDIKDNISGYTTNTGTVTSVAVSGSTGISVSGSPITTSGTITITNTGVTGVKGNAESSYRTGQVNLTAANIGAVGKNDEMLTTNPFAPVSLKGPYISKIDNGFYAADKRWNVSMTNITGSVASLFDGSYESNVIIGAGKTGVLTMDFSPSTYFPGYPYGYILISFYHTGIPVSISGRVYCNYQSHGIGWHDIAFTPISDSGSSTMTYRSEHQGYYNISQLEISIVGATDPTTKVTQVEIHLDRPDSSRTPFLSKYQAERLYYDLTAPNFIGNLTGNVTGNVSGSAGSVAWSGITSKPTTISGYGTTDAKIASGVITLGSNTITPLTSSSTLNAAKLSGAIPSGVTTTTQTAGDNSTKIATTAYVDSAITALPEPMIFKGSLGTGGTITSLPTAAAANEGFTYKVITAGTYASQAAKVGDTFISDGSAWILIPSGDEPSGTVTNVAIQSATNNTISVSGSPITSSGTITLGVKLGYTTSGNNRAVQADTNGNLYVVQKDDNSNTTYTLTNALASHKYTWTFTAGGSGSGSTTTTAEFVQGTGITLTDDTTNKKITIANSGVRSISTGSANGTISVNTGGTTADVAVKGLGSNAYSSVEYLPLTGGSVTGPVSFGDSVDIEDLTTESLVVEGSASIVDNLAVNSINGVTVGSSPKFTDTVPTTTQSKVTGISIANHGTTSVGSASGWSTGTASSWTFEEKTIPNVTSAGSASSWTFEEKTIPNVTSAGTASSWTFEEKTIPNVTAAGSGSASLTLAMDSTDTKQLNITFSHTHTAPTIGTAIKVQSKSGGSNGTAPTLGTAIKVQSKSGGSNGTAPTLGTAIKVQSKSGGSNSTVPSLTITSTTVVNGATHTITDNGHTHAI